LDCDLAEDIKEELEKVFPTPDFNSSFSLKDYNKEDEIEREFKKVGPCQNLGVDKAPERA
jgi:hypothetical protein